MGHPDEPIFLVNERDQEFYVVEAILGRRWNELKQTNEYKIKWKYWSSPDHDSWEEEHRLKYCDDLKTEFDHTHPGKRIASMSTTVAKKPKNVTHSSAKSCQKSQSWKATTFSTANQALAHQESATTSASSKRDRGLLGLSKEADASLKVTLAKSDQGYSVKQPSSAEKTVHSEQAPQNQKLAKKSLSARKEQIQATSSTSELGAASQTPTKRVVTSRKQASAGQAAAPKRIPVPRTSAATSLKSRLKPSTQSSKQQPSCKKIVLRDEPHHFLSDTSSSDHDD